MQRLPINDTNLRLILSKGHDDWFRKEIRDRWIAISVLLVLLSGCLIYAGVWYLIDDVDVPVIYVDETVSAETIKSYEADGYVVRHKTAESSVSDEGKTTFGNDHRTLLSSEVAIFSILLIASPFLLMFVGKAYLEIKKLMRWQNEHHEFLQSHGRTPD